MATNDGVKITRDFTTFVSDGADRVRMLRVNLCEDGSLNLALKDSLIKPAVGNSHDCLKETHSCNYSPECLKNLMVNQSLPMDSFEFYELMTSINESNGKCDTNGTDILLTVDVSLNGKVSRKIRLILYVEEMPIETKPTETLVCPQTSAEPIQSTIIGMGAVLDNTPRPIRNAVITLFYE